MQLEKQTLITENVGNSGQRAKAPTHSLNT